MISDGNLLAAILKRPRTPPTNNPTMDYQTADSEHVLKRARPFGLSEEVLPSFLFFFLFIFIPLKTLFLFFMHSRA